MDDADYASAHASHHSQVDHERLMGMQRGAERNHSSRFFARADRDADAVGRWALNSLNTDANIASEMNPFNAMYEAASGSNPMTGQSVDWEHAYENFASSTAGLFTAEIGGAILGAGARLAGDVLPSVGRNVASMFGNSEVNALSPMRLRVMQNIADTRAGIERSDFPVLTAKENQILSGYHADEWEMTTLRKGDLVYGGLPGQSTYYTDEEALLNSNGDKNILYPNLQVKLNPERGAYRPNVGVYQLTDDIRVPTGIVKANPELGPGGATQFFIDRHLLPKLNLLNEFELRGFYEQTMSTHRPSY